VLVHPAAPTTQQVVSFTLINADTEQPIRDLVPNDVIDMATLPTRNLNIRANTEPYPVGSVKFVMSGKQNRTQTETGAPYALFGDDNGNYRNWTPALGNYSLTATPYTEASAKGTAGTPLTINFSVTDLAANQAPTANAGADQTITLPTNTVTLAGSGNDPDGSIAAHQWTQQSGPNTATLVNANTASLTANDLVAGTYTFRLTVTDNQGATGFDEVSVQVNAAPANQAPTANAGADQTITLPTNTVTLAGSGNDPDGSIAAHQWTQQSGPNTATLVNANTASLTANDLVAGTYTFRLTVTDNQGATAHDEVSVQVNAAPTVQQVVSFTLINADTEQPIRDLVPNDVIDMATLPTRNLNIRANTEPYPVGSVKFVMSGKQNRTQTETGAPYALFGDDNGNYRNWTPALGNYSLTATPYTEASAKGTAGTPLIINFSVINQSIARLGFEYPLEPESLQVKYYPNPFAETITLQVQGKGSGKLPAILFDVTGRVVMQLEDLQAEQTITLGKEVAPGTYFLHVGAGRKVKTYKLIKTE
ncbi:PKD domain-containing protein, partial [Telluribacter sp. SYSU D00476]|uniref:PKD domain-containing protein n=1 Tax=Telluribacter sp. SYSU D00476 TaxID=2811430 RepID=UPI001FF5F9BA